MNPKLIALLSLAAIAAALIAIAAPKVGASWGTPKPAASWGT